MTKKAEHRAWRVSLSLVLAASVCTPERVSAQEVDAARFAAVEVEHSPEWYTLDHHLRVQIRRSRLYGGLLVAGAVVAVVGVVGTAAYIFDSPEASIFAVTGIVGASIFVTGVVGLIVSGVRRIHLRARRDALAVAPYLFHTTTDTQLGLALGGSF